MRPEHEIFNDLSALCTSPGYIHALAVLSFQSGLVIVDQELTAEIMSSLYSPSRLISTEVSTLVGLMMRGPISFEVPQPSTMLNYSQRTQSLLKELHQAIIENGTKVVLREVAADQPSNPFGTGEVLREIIFYGSLSAYAFQYRDMAPMKYAADAEWLSTNKGVCLDVCHAVCRTVVEILQVRVVKTQDNAGSTAAKGISILPGFTFSCSEVAERAKLSPSDVRAVLRAFSLPKEERNSGFTSLNRFNVAYAYPLIPKSADEFVLLQHYSIAEAFYNTPFYWMLADDAYASVASRNRGEFTEAFAYQKLIQLFGERHVFRNVDIQKSKRETLGEIDVLVIFGDQAIVLQAKSKMLTLEARSGNETELRKDFKAAVQDAADQALICAKTILLEDVQLRSRDGRPIPSLANVREILPISAVSDHYPALAFQASQFLDAPSADHVARVLTLDLFALDTMTEMLGSPLRFISYLHLRARFGSKLVFGHENTPLGYHLKNNLWLEDGTDLLLLQDDYGTEVDVAMSVRRDAVPGNPVPEGILTRLTHTSVGALIAELEQVANPAAIRLGLLLLELSEHAVKRISDAINATVEKAQQDGELHDVTVSLSDAASGITIYCGRQSDAQAMTGLQRHCTLRKRLHDARQWFGVALRTDRSLQLVGALIDA